MNENEREEQEPQEEITSESEDDDLKAYLAEMKALESDFSDLEDLDMEEILEMQEAIATVKEGEEITVEGALQDEISIESEKITNNNQTDYLEQKETMISDFSDMDGIDFDELKEMKDAIESVKEEEEGEVQQPQEISSELEERIKEELSKRKKEEEKEVITTEKFLEYIKEKRDKIWYHALWYLVFNVDDHIASKFMLYDVLKEVTSKSAIDPIPEHQFYFGLGYILRLNVNNKQVVRYMSGAKFKININIDNFKEMLEESGEPISHRPIIEEVEKKKMYSDFLKDDFLDI